MIGQTLGHYRILEKVGAGGMGVVYRARDEQLERDVALKVLPPGTLTNEVARRHFRKEALALAKLNHPNIETVYEFNSQDGTDFLVMEYVPGKTLADRLVSGRLPEKEVVTLGMQIVAAIEEAHNRGIIHRDLKPRNIAITVQGQAKVLDFGLAKLLPQTNAVTSETLTDTQAGAGTLPYMSPEQLQGEPVDARADIYTAGAVLYEMAAGRRAFAEELPSRLIDAILHQPPVAPRALSSRISPELERTILKCLDKEPARRYQSAKELLVDLRRLDTTSSTHTMPPTPSPFVWRRVTRLAAFGMAGLLTFAVLMTGLNVGGWRNRLAGRLRSPQIRSLAVLPLENRSQDPEQEYLADGLTDELITELSRISTLKIISRTSVMRYKNTDKPLPEIAKSLNVDGVVEGSVQRVGDRVKISARLIQARNDQELWARSYERGLNDVLALQYEVAQAITGSIEGALKPNEMASLQRSRPLDPVAHEAYLKGLYYWNKRTPEGLKKALQYFERAIDTDPKYALAYAGLSYTYAFAPDLGLPSEIAKEKQKAAALKAVQLDDELPEAHTSLGGALEDDWDWSGAELEYKRAIELNPNYATARHWYSVHLSVLGRHDEAIAEAKRALELDPLSLIIQANLGRRYLNGRHYDEAIQECAKVLEMDSSFVLAHDCLGFAHLQKGRFDAAIAEFRAAADLSHGDPRSISALGYAYAISGKADEAARILRRLSSSSESKYFPAYYLAIVETGLGKKDDAFEWLERAYRTRSAELPDAKTEPMLDGLRSDPRLDHLIRRMGLPI
jgi:eukaryotic-like serine/threonine-protein kinase